MLKPKHAYRSTLKLKAFQAMVDAHEANDHEAATRRRRDLRNLYSLPVWIRPAVLDGAMYLFLLGILVVYDHAQFAEQYHERRNGEA